MNKSELKILREVIRNVTRKNKNAWWELKRQIWESGYQATYPLTEEFRVDVELQLEKLPIRTLDELRSEYMRQSPSTDLPSDYELINEYAPRILEEISRRATIAAYRTIHW